MKYRLLLFLMAAVSPLFIFGCQYNSEHSLPADVESFDPVSVITADVGQIPEVLPVPVDTVGNHTGPMVGMPVATAADQAGRLFVADGQQNSTHLFHPEGRYIKTIGAPGEGPGEFRAIGGLVVEEEFLHILDPVLMRISRFYSDTFELDMMINIPGEGSPSAGMLPYTFFVRPDGTYLIVFSRSPQRGEKNSSNIMWEAVILHENGMYEDSVFLSFPANEWLYEFTEEFQISIVPPYGRKSHLMMGQNGSLLHAWSEHLFIKKYDVNGAYQRGWYIDIPKKELRRGEAMEQFNSGSLSRDPRFRRLLAEQDMPETWPAFQNIIVDDYGRFWISTYTEDHRHWRWLIFDASTESVVGTFIWPRSRSIQDIKNNHIYVLEIDESTGRQVLVKFRHDDF